jgi:hypothetical protein
MSPVIGGATTVLELETLCIHSCISFSFLITVVFRLIVVVGNV